MATYTYEISTEHNIYPNLTVYDWFRDGVLCGWKVEPNPGYVFYDTNDDYREIDENGNEVSVIHYFTSAQLPLIYDWSNFSLVAVPRDSVDENYIFGVGDDNNHEVM